LAIKEQEKASLGNRFLGVGTETDCSLLVNKKQTKERER